MVGEKFLKEVGHGPVVMLRRNAQEPLELRRHAKPYGDRLFA